MGRAGVVGRNRGGAVRGEALWLLEERKRVGRRRSNRRGEREIRTEREGSRERKSAGYDMVPSIAHPLDRFRLRGRLV